MAKETLAANGGPKAVPDGTIKPWPEIDDTDRRLVLESLQGERHAYGPNCEALEREFTAHNGNKYALTTNSGTASLHMALAACGLQAGDEVLVPAYTWSSSATCVMHHNCIPVFVDIDFATMNMDLDKIEPAVTKKTKAIVAVHLHGLPLNMDKLMEIARRRGLKVIEDACQAQGSTWRGKKVGTFGDAAAFSFNQNKVVCSGEGGMFATDDKEICERADKLRYFGETRDPAKLPDNHAHALGWMYRNNDLTAAFARAQLMKLDRNLKTQKENAVTLSNALKGVPALIPPYSIEHAGHNWYNYTIRFDMKALGHEKDAALFRDRIVSAMTAEGVQTGVWQSFILPAMTVFRARNGYGHGCPWDCHLARKVEYIPENYPVAQAHCDTHTGMTVPLRHPNGKKEVELTAAGIRKVMEGIADIP